MSILKIKLFSPITIALKSIYGKKFEKTNPEISSIFELYGSDESYMLKLINVEGIEVYRYWYLYNIVNEFVSEFNCLLILLRCIFLSVREILTKKIIKIGPAKNWVKWIVPNVVGELQGQIVPLSINGVWSIVWQGLIFKSDSQRTRFSNLFQVHHRTLWLVTVI